MHDHAYYMRRAIQVALENTRAPFGTVVVDIAAGDIVVEGLNRAAANPIMHGEIVAIHRYAECGYANWGGLRLYTTGEPCCMCQAAIIWSGIPEVVFGTSIQKLAELGWNQFDLTAEKVNASARFANCKILGGVLAEDCDRLFERAKA